MEDNGPVGYKSRKAEKAKKECKITPVNLPRYSSDLNPLDYFLWSEVERRMAKHKTKPKETMAVFKQRLRRTALAIRPPVIRKAVGDMKTRAKAIYDANSHDVAVD